MIENIAKGKIGNALTSTANDHVVAVANDIYDENLNKYQSQINDEVEQSVFVEIHDPEEVLPQPEVPETYEDSNYAYNWKTTDTPASDGKREGNLKDLYQTTLDSEEKLSKLEGKVGAEKTLINDAEVAHSARFDFKIKRGQKYSVKNVGNNIISFLTYDDSNTQIDSLGDVAVNQTKVFVASGDAIKVGGYANSMQYRVAIVSGLTLVDKELEDDIKSQDIKIANLSDKVIDWESAKRVAAVMTTDAFVKRTDSYYRIIPVKGGDKVKFTANGELIYFVLSAWNESDTTPSFASGFSGRGTESELTLPNDAKFIAYQELYYNLERTPKLFSINGYDVIKGIKGGIADSQSRIGVLEAKDGRMAFHATPHKKGSNLVSLSDTTIQIKNALWNIHGVDNKWTSINVVEDVSFELTNNSVILLDTVNKKYKHTTDITNLPSTDIILLVCAYGGKPSSGVLFEHIIATENEEQDKNIIKIGNKLADWESCNRYSGAIYPETFKESSSSFFRLIPVASGDNIKIIENAELIYFVLSDWHEGDITPSFAYGFTGRGTLKEFVAPSNAKYIAYQDIYYNLDRAPKSLLINGHDIMKGSLEERLEHLENGLDRVSDKIELPVAYEEHYAEKISSAKDKLSMADGDSFIFFTDSHGNEEMYHTDVVLKNLVYNLGIKKVIFGGDAVKSSINSKEEAVESWFNSVRFASLIYEHGASLYPVRGNHDIQTTNNSYSATDGCTRQLILSKLSNAVTKNDDSCNYYLDDSVSKIRYIFLDTYRKSNNVIGMNIANANNWLKSSILSTDEGWEIIVVLHQGLTTDTNEVSEVNVTLPLYETLLNANNKVGDMAEAKASIVMVLSGHNHRDGESFKGGILNITSTSIHTPVWDLYKSDKTMTANTPSETAVDVFAYSKTDKVLEVVRFGRGYDRRYNLSAVGVSSGSTKRLSSSLETVTNWMIWDVEGTSVTSYTDWDKAVVSNNYASINNGVVSGLTAGECVAVAIDDVHKKREFFYVKVE